MKDERGDAEAYLNEDHGGGCLPLDNFGFQ